MIHIIKKHGTTDINPEVVENDAALLEQYLMPLRNEATEYRKNNLQINVLKQSSIDEEGNIIYGEVQGPFIEEMNNYDNIKGMVKLETLFDYEYELINEFLQTSEPGIIRNVNMYFLDLLIPATDFMKINLLWDMEDASTDYKEVGNFLFQFKELFKKYYNSLNGLQLKYYNNRDWYDEIDKFRKDNNNNLEAINTAMEQHYNKMRFIYDACMYVGQFY